MSVTIKDDYMLLETEFRLEVDSNPALKEYIDMELAHYNRAYRYAFRVKSRPSYRKEYPKDSYFCTHICQMFNLSKRQANSMINDIDANLKSYWSQKEDEKAKLESLVKTEEENKKFYDLFIDTNKPLAIDHKLDSKKLDEYRTVKKRAYWNNQKLIRHRAQLKRVSDDITNGKVRVSFDKYNIFSKQNNLEQNHYANKQEWYDDYVKSRDTNRYLLGSCDEINGNSEVRIECTELNESYGVFNLKIHKLNEFCTKEDKYLEINAVRIKYLHDDLVWSLHELDLSHPYYVAKGRIPKIASKIVKMEEESSKTSLTESKTNTKLEELKATLDELNSVPFLKSYPIHYRIVRKQKGYYVQIYLYVRRKRGLVSDKSSYSGCIGLDYNSGFITACRIDTQGNKVEVKNYYLEQHGKGSKGKTELEGVAIEILADCRKYNCFLVKEDLDFKQTKANTKKAKSSQGKNYNRMIHTLDYRRLDDIFTSRCFKEGVLLVKVNPAYTSKIGKKKYLKPLNFNSVHESASYVIARRGFGFKDYYIQNNDPKYTNKLSDVNVYKETCIAYISMIDTSIKELTKNIHDYKQIKDKTKEQREIQRNLVSIKKEFSNIKKSIKKSHLNKAVKTLNRPLLSEYQKYFEDSIVSVLIYEMSMNSHLINEYRPYNVTSRTARQERRAVVL